MAWITDRRGNWQPGFAKLPEGVERFLFENNATLSSLLVLLALSRSADADGTRCWPSYETICDRTGVSKTTVRRALDLLADIGIVEIVRPAGGRGNPGDYRLHWPPRQKRSTHAERSNGQPFNPRRTVKAEEAEKGDSPDPLSRVESQPASATTEPEKVPSGGTLSDQGSDPPNPEKVPSGGTLSDQGSDPPNPEKVPSGGTKKVPSGGTKKVPSGGTLLNPRLNPSPPTGEEKREHTRSVASATKCSPSTNGTHTGQGGEAAAAEILPGLSEGELWRQLNDCKDTSGVWAIWQDVAMKINQLVFAEADARGIGVKETAAYDRHRRGSSIYNDVMELKNPRGFKNPRKSPR